MGLFDWITKKHARPDTPWIDKDDFVEDLKEDSEENKENHKIHTMTPDPSVDDAPEQKPVLEGIELIENFLSKDFGPQGYRNALVNPDTSNADENKEMLKYQLELIIDKALSQYRDKIRVCDFHIKTRGKNLMQDTVDEIESEKGNYLEKIKNIEAILTEAKQNKGKGHIIILSYDLGFKRGLAAITASKVFGKNIPDE